MPDWTGRALLAAVALTGEMSAARASELAWRFEWLGNGGYEMRGAIAIDAALAERDYVYAEDVECFVVEGYHEGRPIGRWALGMKTDETSWALTFRPRQNAFEVFGPQSPMPQAWNMNGFGTDCGREGFGFNIGNAAQDLCLDGHLLTASQVTPSRPFPATRDDAARFPRDACLAPALLGQAESGAARPAAFGPVTRPEAAAAEQ
ncbi:hypothetical protein CLG85_025740 [Yangia mangrovi]|uniref:Uncharacterized protein n=1 Tax=Alloyangia mangrovi TaxID=1779329 RepID=A0ABT2KVW3_9RHOB|nr:hypothetical protein [Alloyangia mangrovi]MCT4373513.1 hypothetical protein [Alloyangia mangrovi]